MVVRLKWKKDDPEILAAKMGSPDRERTYSGDSDTACMTTGLVWLVFEKDMVMNVLVGAELSLVVRTPRPQISASGFEKGRIAALSSVIFSGRHFSVQLPQQGSFT
jgi:hypothetical protein